MPSEPSSSEDPLPASVIAQAEAACAGNVEEEESLKHRRLSTVSQGHSHLHEPLQERSGDEQSNLSLGRAASRFGDTLGVEGIADAPPEYSGHIEISQDGFDTKANVTDDGRVNISINQKTRKLSDLLVPALRSQLSLVAQENEQPLPPGYIPPALGGQPGQVPPPRLNVVIQVVGSRGDVQPFVALGKILKSTYGHRVRLATHPTFQSFVEENGLEFFSIGGDPAELMAFMVKNPGLMPGFDSLKSGDVGKRRKGMEEIVLGCWRSCIEAGDGLSAPVRENSSAIDRLGFNGGINMDTNPNERPFIADAIIANPPSFAHIHIAEKLGIPLHMMFTMPWSPTQSFPHPLANIQSSNADVNMTNFMSYALVEMMTWQGLGDVINRFRQNTLDLEPVSLMWAPGMLSRLKVPYTYCWSPALIPKPKDWGRQISISGFFFLNLASTYQPDHELAAFLDAGPPPVYIGFGSIVVDDPDSMTTMIFEAVKKAGVRALVSKGWGGLGGNALNVPEGVFMLGNVPHDWLFKRVSCVVHHGGAGTSAAGISLGRPTVVVPFFGDQPWWGAMIHRAGAGPAPIPYKQLSASKLAAGIAEAMKPETLTKAQELGASISQEKGTEVGGKSFHDHLDCDKLRCSLAPERVAVWRVKRTQTRLSALAATVLANEGLLDFGDLKLYRAREYETEDGPWDPISGGASALIGTMASLAMGVADVPVEIFKAFKPKQGDSGKEESTLTNSQSGSVSHGNSDLLTVIPGDSVSRQQSQLSLTSLDNELSNPQASSTASTLDVQNESGSEFTGITKETSETSAPSSAAAGALKQALSNTLPSSRSTSQDRRSRSRPSSPSRKEKESAKQFDPSSITLESAIGASKGLSRIVGAGLKSPMDFTLGLARGFHNAPKLYGDDTVRPQEKVTDFQSGLRAAGKEFGYGFYDGISGLITQPLKGAEKEGTAGLLKGIGRGIGGLVLKPGAAIWGLPGYTMMGIHKEVRKLFGASVQNYIISARTAQGYEQWKSSTAAERVDIISRWQMAKSELQSMRQKIQEQGGPEGQESGRLSPRGFLQTRHLSFDERKKLHEARKEKRKISRETSYGEHIGIKCPFCSKKAAHHHDREPTTETSHGQVAQQPVPEIVEPVTAGNEFENAIQASVRATSRGNHEEDAAIERAIRASIRELHAHQEAETEQEALDRAIKASIAEAQSSRQGEALNIEQANLLTKAIERSLAESRNLSSSKAAYDDKDLERAIEESKANHEKPFQAKTEEEIVMNYVIKQSLAEEEHRKAMEGTKGGG